MLNILILSDESKQILPLFKASGFTADTQNPNRASEVSGAPVHREGYDIAFLDLDVENWQQRLLEVRHRLPVIVFSHPDLKKTVEAVKLGATDYLEKPLTTETVDLSCIQIYAQHPDFIR